MKTIELIRKLSELGRLVEIWENPFTVTRYPYHWEDYTEEEFAKLSENKKYWDKEGVTIRKQKYVQDAPIEYTEMQNERGEVLTTESFKAEVRKVAGELMVLDKHCDPKFYTLDFNKNILKLSFDELFKRLLGDINTSLHASQLLIAICHKMGVELEREGK